jgi:hypothetical protein
VVAGKNLEVASLSVGATQFVDVVNQVVTKDESVAAGAQVSMKINIRPGSYPEKTRKELLNQILHKQYAFVRVGAKTQGVGERIYSTVQKVELK